MNMPRSWTQPRVWLTKCLIITFIMNWSDKRGCFPTDFISSHWQLAQKSEELLLCQILGKPLYKNIACILSFCSISRSNSMKSTRNIDNKKKQSIVSSCSCNMLCESKLLLVLASPYTSEVENHIKPHVIKLTPKFCSEWEEKDLRCTTSMKLQKIFQNIDFEGKMTKIALGFSGSQRLSWNLIRVAPESVRTQNLHNKWLQ